MPFDETYLGGEYHEDGQLEDNAEGEDENRYKIDKFVDRDNRLELGGLEAEQEFNAVSQGDGVAEPGTQVKQYGGEEYEPAQGFFRELERLAQGHPETVHNARHQHEDGYEK